MESFRPPKETINEWFKALFFGVIRLQGAGESQMVTEPLRELMQYLSIAFKDELDAMQEIDKCFKQEIAARLPPPQKPPQ